MGAVNDIADWAGRAKRLYDISKELKNIELIEALADLRVALADWKTKFAELGEENLELQAKIKELQKQVSVSNDIVFRDGLYYRADPVEGKPNGPFCPQCFEGGGDPVTLTSQAGTAWAVFGQFKCPKCTQTFGKKGVHSELEDEGD